MRKEYIYAYFLLSFLIAIHSNLSSKSRRIVFVCLFAGGVPSPKLRATSIKKTTIFQTLFRRTRRSVQRTAQIYNLVSLAHEWSLHSSWRRYVSRMS